MTIRSPSFDEILFIIKNGWHDFFNTDFVQLKYAAVDLAVKVGAVMAALILLKLAWILLCKIFDWHKYSRMDSGHTSSRDSERGFLAGFLLTLPKVALLAPLAAILFAVADPFFAITKEEKKYITTRTRIDLRDVSGSMEQWFEKSGKSKGEIAMNAHLEFLEMRRGKKDRIAFWMFSDDPYPIQEDFIIDDELVYLKAYDAPWVIDSGYYDNGRSIVPRSRFLRVSGQGGTQLSKPLKMVIRLFDDDEEKQKKTLGFKTEGRSVLIITDAIITDFEKTLSDFEELSKRKITPYIIFINNGEYYPMSNQGLLLQEVISRGGKFFPVSDEKAIESAYREIDKLEAVKIKVEKRVFKISVFYKFVFFAITCLIIAIITGLLVALLSYP